MQCSFIFSREPQTKDTKVPQLSDCSMLVGVCVYVCMYVLPLECIRKTKAATNGKQNVAYSEAFAEACHTCKCKCKKAKANIKHKTRLTATAAKVSASCRVSSKTKPGNIGLQNFVLPFKLVAHLRDRLLQLKSPWNSLPNSAKYERYPSQNRDYAHIMANISHWELSCIFLLSLSHNNHQVY